MVKKLIDINEDLWANVKIKAIKDNKSIGETMDEIIKRGLCLNGKFK